MTITEVLVLLYYVANVIQCFLISYDRTGRHCTVTRTMPSKISRQSKLASLLRKFFASHSCHINSEFIFRSDRF